MDVTVMRDTKAIQASIDKANKDKKAKALQKTLRKEVNTGGSGTQNYVIKKGVNAGKVASKKQ
jgi:tartrate dehydratase alpha subunit/fumarate hydratase class I-like protein